MERRCATLTGKRRVVCENWAFTTIHAVRAGRCDDARAGARIVAGMVRGSIRGLGAWDEGYTWESKQGVRKVVRVRGDRYFITTGASPHAQILPASEMADEIARDQANVASQRKDRDAIEAGRRAEAAAIDVDGFDRTLSSKAAAKAVEALNKQVSVNSRFAKRKDHIKRMLKEGYRVEIDSRGRRVFVSPGGGFFFEKDLTKTGLDYAEHLSSKGLGLGKIEVEAPVEAYPKHHWEPLLILNQVGSRPPRRAILCHALRFDVSRGRCMTTEHSGSGETARVCKGRDGRWDLVVFKGDKGKRAYRGEMASKLMQEAC